MIIDKNKLKAGDVLLAFSKVANDIYLDKYNITLCYSHAAICTKNNMIIDSLKSGVRETTVDNLLKKYEYISVLRNPYWDNNLLNKLHGFLENCIKEKSKFNHKGASASTLENRKKEHEETINEQLTDFFDGKIENKFSYKESYFCSELIVSAFRKINIIDEATSILYRPEVMCPDSLAEEPIFGHFYGYLVCDDDYQIPETDRFYNEFRFNRQVT
ncbi:MAG: hypothetical protein Q8Q54_11880 [Methylococcales bacterium]|nr:hypothetical protein [Methylococcales bacterium]